MNTRTLFLALLAPAALAAGLDAQAAAGRIQIRRDGPAMMVDTVVFRDLLQRRARLGVTVNLDPSDTDSLGAALVAVTPGGPAAKAGIRSGDVITRLDGNPLVVPGSSSRAVSAPGTRLIELAAKLEPNDTIPVEYVRNGRRTTTQLVTAEEAVLELGQNGFAFRFPGEEDRTWVRAFPDLRVERFSPDVRRRLEEQTETGRRVEIQRIFGGPLTNLELASLNADLATYFGTTDGVLVLTAPGSASLPLKGGDVILSVDGRRANTPSSLIRILRSYELGDTFKLEIMRQKKRETITGKMER